ncbi:MAG TPA: glycoside hydrolase family 38 C-terminal domain-containing protein [Acidobacteriaceae bacterium]|nr:glycoside hydrolase family 38 C-terminal domain-containing protein [Acidobacteriaceae bacterium]
MERSGVSRRAFLLGGAAAVGTLATSEVRAQKESGGGASRPVLHIIGYSHIDAAWLWPWRDGANLVLTTARSALDRIEETPGFRYSHSSSMHYRWIQQSDPAMFAEILQRIREGRWEVVGGWPVEPDCNLPSTESFARHCLYGKSYCQSSLGVDVKIGFNPDSFGHGAGLPSILKQAGYEAYVFMRPRPEDGTSLPLLFWWEGPDGSRVLTLRILNSYENPAERVRSVAASSFAPGFSHGAFFLGVGDHGGAVTRAQIQAIQEMQKDATLPELRWSTVGEFFAAVRSSPAMAGLPVIRGGLQHHARGCYSACGEEKYQNRRAERALLETESLALFSSVAMSRPYPRAEFEAGWWNILFNQFHDLLAGSALYSDYQDARDGLGAACQTAQARKLESLQAMARQVDTSRAEAGVIFAFNSLPWPRRALLEYIPSKGSGTITHLKAEDGSTMPAQSRPSASMTNFYPRLSAWVDLPAFGYRVLSEESGAPPAAPPYGSSFSISQEGFGLSSLKAGDGTELLASPMGLVVIADPSDTWAHGVDQFRQEIGRPTFVSSKVVEEGPVLRVTRQRFRWRQSEIAADIAVFPGLDVVRFHFVIDWRERQQILKLEIPSALDGARVFAMVPGAIEERSPNGQEEPYQDWVALEGQIQGRDYTLGLLNNSTYSYDCLNPLLRTILIRSAPYARHDPNRVQEESLDAWQDQGRQERIFWLTGRRGRCLEQSFDRLSNELQSPAEYVMDSRHKGSERWEKSFFRISPATVAVLSMKQAEDASGAMILRLQERTGQSTVVHLESGPLGLSETVPLRPWEIRTVRIGVSPSRGSRMRAVSLLEA